MKIEEQKTKILDTLKKFGLLPTSKVSAIAGINPEYAKNYLKELENEGKIESQKAGELATYWKVKNG